MWSSAKFIGGVCVAALLALAGAQALAAQEAQPGDRARFLQSKSCDRCDLHGQGFDKLDLKGASLAGANLAGATFYKADLTNANLAGADLTKAVLPFADLTNVNLAGANLTGANLSSAIGADLTAAITTDSTTCPNGQAGPCR
jgi:uncharacterized protein YjbI with pentapeptide repeats